MQSENTSVNVADATKQCSITFITASKYKNYDLIPLTKIFGGPKNDHHNKLYIAVQECVSGLDSLSAARKKYGSNIYTAMIRGDVIAGVNTTKAIERTMYAPEKGYTGNIESHKVGKPWIQIDYDNIKLSDSINVLTHPKEAVEYAVSLLPEYLQNVDYDVQLSSSCGMKGEHSLSAHVFIWLDRPIHDDSLRAWANSWNDHVGGKIIDPALFNPIQLHYIVNPIFLGDLKDPYPDNRDWKVTKAHRFATFPPESTFHNLPKATDSEPDSISGNTKSVNSSFQVALEEIGDHEGGKGFKKHIFKTLCSYFYKNNPDQVDIVWLTKVITKKCLQADCSDSDHGQAYVLKYLATQLDQEIKKAKDFSGKKYFANKALHKETGNKGLILGVEPYYKKLPFKEKKTYSAELKKAVAECVKGYSNNGVKAPCGSGKSVAYYETVAKLADDGYYVEIYVPTTKLAYEAADKLHAINPNMTIGVMRGRNVIHEEFGNCFPMCHRHKAADLVSKAGHGVYNVMCMKYKKKTPEDYSNAELKIIKYIKKIESDDSYTSEEKLVLIRSGKESISHYSVKKCGGYDTCLYIKQWESNSNVRIYPHAYLGQDRNLLDKIDVTKEYRIVLDEQFHKSLLSNTDDVHGRVPFVKIEESGWNPEFIELLVNAPKDQPLYQYMLDKFDEKTLSCHIYDSIKISKSQIQEQDDLIDIYPPEQVKYAETMEAKSNTIKFLKVMDEELTLGKSESIAFIVKDDHFEMFYRKPITRFSYNKDGEQVHMPITIIDADLNKKINDLIFPAVNYFDFNVEKNCRYIQCYNSTNSKFSINNGGDGRIAEANSLILRLESEGNRVLVIGNKEIIAEKILVGANSAKIHFNNLRGYDGFKDFDCAVLIGRVEPSCDDLERVARQLFYDLPHDLKLRMENLKAEIRGYRLKSGWKVGREMRVHTDPTIQELLELIREAEILQAIDRLRLVYNDCRKDVYILTNVVLDLDIDHLLQSSEMAQGFTKLSQAWSNVDGVLPLSQKWLEMNLPVIFHKGGAKAYFERIGNSIPQLMNSLFISDPAEVLVYEYSLEGNKGTGLKCLSKRDKHQTVIALSQLHDVGVKTIKLL